MADTVSREDGAAAELKDGAAYEVGYGKPPKRTRFQPGVSGNPKGRGKAKKAHKTIVSEVFNEKIRVQTPRGPKTMTKFEAALHTNMNKALKGDARAFEHLLKLGRDYGLFEDPLEAMNMAKMDAISEDDRAILARFSAAEEMGGDTL